MLDSFNRTINYLRISVTDKCNLRCVYCMPAEGVKLMDHKDILSVEEIIEIVDVLSRKGLNKVRLTGGEPLVRKGILEIVRGIAKNKKITDLSITTNAIFLEKFAQDLYDAGLDRINISLDTTNAQKYKEITRGGDINKVYAGINKAKEVGFKIIKLNCVVKENRDEEDAQLVKAYGDKNGLETRFISQMDLEKGHFSIVDGGSGGDCAHCNRLRLTADGHLKPCLFNNLTYSVKELGIEKAIQQALQNKPKCGSFNSFDHFNNIGG